MSQIIYSDKPLPTCPFCDHPARIELCGESTTHPTYHVGCYNKDCMILPTVGTALLEEALSAWNTRIETQKGIRDMRPCELLAGAHIQIDAHNRIAIVLQPAAYKAFVDDIKREHAETVAATGQYAAMSDTDSLTYNGQLFARFKGYRR